MARRASGSARRSSRLSSTAIGEGRCVGRAARAHPPLAKALAEEHPADEGEAPEAGRQHRRADQAGDHGHRYARSIECPCRPVAEGRLRGLERDLVEEALQPSVVEEDGQPHQDREEEHAPERAPDLVVLSAQPGQGQHEGEEDEHGQSGGGRRQHHERARKLDHEPPTRNRRDRHRGVGRERENAHDQAPEGQHGPREGRRVPEELSPGGPHGPRR